MTTPKVMMPGHEEKIIRLVRLIPVGGRIILSCVWRPRLVLLSEFCLSVPDPGFRGCCIAVWIRVTWLLFSVCTNESFPSELCHLRLLDFFPTCTVKSSARVFSVDGGWAVQ